MPRTSMHWTPSSFSIVNDKLFKWFNKFDLKTTRLTSHLSPKRKKEPKKIKIKSFKKMAMLVRPVICPIVGPDCWLIPFFDPPYAHLSVQVGPILWPVVGHVLAHKKFEIQTKEGLGNPKYKL